MENKVKFISQKLFMSDNVTNHTNAKWEEGSFFVIKTSWINFCKTHMEE